MVLGVRRGWLSGPGWRGGGRGDGDLRTPWDRNDFIAAGREGVEESCGGGVLPGLESAQCRARGVNVLRELGLREVPRRVARVFVRDTKASSCQPPSVSESNVSHLETLTQ